MLFARVLGDGFAGAAHQWSQILVIIAIASVAVGAFAGLRHRHCGRIGENLGKQARVVRRQMHDDDEGQSRMRRHRAEEALERIEAAGRGADRDIAQAIVGMLAAGSIRLRLFEVLFAVSRHRFAAFHTRQYRLPVLGNIDRAGLFPRDE